MVSLCILALTGLIFSVSAIDIPVSTRYLTTEVTILNTSVTLVGLLCGQAKGKTVNVTVVLINNPTWILDDGVIYYYVVDSPSKTSKDALCSNNIGGKVGAYCSVKTWPSGGDLYIMGMTGPVEAVLFRLYAEIISKNAKNLEEPQHTPRAKPLPDDLFGRKLREEAKTVFLKEYITLTASSALPRLQEAHITFTFCPTPEIGSQYVITSTVHGTEEESSWALYICDKYPCELGYPDHIIAFNERELPSNTVQTPPGQWNQMYALIICWGGPYDPVKKEFIGHFQFNAIASKK